MTVIDNNIDRSFDEIFQLKMRFFELEFCFA